MNIARIHKEADNGGRKSNGARRSGMAFWVAATVSFAGLLDAHAATHISENIQSWTVQTSYGSWAQSIPAGTVNMTQCIVAPTAAANGDCTVGRVQMQGSTGILELPAVNTAGVVSFNLVAGGAGRSVKLQQNVSGGGWVDVVTFSGIGTTGATYSHEVNNSSASIALRLATPSAALYVHDILVEDHASFTPPAFGANPGPVSTTTGVEVVFTVTAAGSPEPVLALQGTTASGGYTFTAGTGGLSYTPPPADADTTKTFTFTASNSAGVATQAVTVTVSSPPVTIPTVSVTNIGTNSFTVNWTACDGATTYQVQIATDTNFAAGGGGGGLFISQYYEGAGNDKWIELYNAGDSAIDLSAEGLQIGIWANAAREAWKIGTAPNSSIVLSGTIAAGGTYLVGNSSAANPTYATADLSSGSLTFNGDDSVVLYAGATYSTGAIVDSIGLAGNSHADTSIVRKSSILSGNTGTTDLTESEWDTYAYTAVDGATSGNPERLGEHGISGGTGGSLVRDETVAALTYAATGLDTETTYFVRARQAGGEWSSVVTATTAGAEASAPVFTGGTGPYGITVGDLLDFTVSAIGTPTPVLALSAASANPGDYAFEPATGYFLYEPPPGDGGTVQTFTFTASNTEGVATQQVSVTVSNVLVLPTIDPLSPLTIEAGQATNLWVVAREADGDWITLGASNLPANASFGTVSGAGAVSNQFSFSPSSNQAGQSYAVVFYAGDADGTNSATLEITVTGDAPWAEYYASCYTNGVLRTGVDLKNALHNIIDDHTSFSYAATENILKVIDECPTNSTMVQLLYLQHGRAKSDFGGTAGQWNREHVWADSHGIGGTPPAFTDLHHLHPADVTVNQTRGDKDFDTVSGLSNTYSYSSTAFEPPDAAKGDVARAMFYMAVRYDGSDGVGDLELTNVIPTSGAWHGKLDTLMDWHELDPVDDYEIRRNDLIYSNYQGNRNPFVDRPEWVRVVFDTNYVAAPPPPAVFAAEASGSGQIDLVFALNGRGDDVIMVWDEDGTFSEPSGTAPAVGQPFAGGTVLYQGGTSPQSHTGLAACQTRYYKCWSVVGTSYSEAGLTDSATTSGPDAPAAVWASETNTTGFTAAWSGVAGVSSYRLEVSLSPIFADESGEWETVFRETMGTVVSTTALSTHEAANGFDNIHLTMTDGGAANPADLRPTASSSGYFDPAGQVASGDANLWFTSTTGERGFGIEGIDVRGFEALQISFGYRKEDANANMTLGVEWSTNSGAVWNSISVSNLPSEDAAIGWYMVSNLAVSAAAQDSTYLSLRWIKTGDVAGRVDDILLQGRRLEPSFLPGYSNRVVMGTSESVTGLTAGATCYFRVASLPDCQGSFSPTGNLAIAEALTPFEHWLHNRELDPQDGRYAEDADADGDGMTTWEEFLADTDPANSNSVLVLEGTYFSAAQTGEGTGQIQFSFPASTARYYQLIHTDDLSATLTNNLGWGVPGMVVTSAAPAAWYGTIRVLLEDPSQP